MYASLSARALDASVVVGGKIGADMNASRLSLLKRAGVNTNHVIRTKGPSTTFRIDYKNGVRRMWTLSKCENITSEDIALLPKSKALHLGPILNEIPPHVARQLVEQHRVTCLDPQGYMRKTLANKRIRRVKWRDDKVLHRLDLLKVSENEARVLLGEKISKRKLSRLGPEVILITKAGSGTTVWSREEGVFEVPAFRTHVSDPTGSGDALVAGTLVTYVRTGELLWSVAVGSAIASFVVERVGPKDFGTAPQIRSRANAIIDSAQKLRGSRLIV